MKPEVSVVMACYREPLHWFESAVLSVLQQTLSNFELIIVVDDPENLEITSFLDKQRKLDERIIVVHNEHNLGLPDSLNKGIGLAKSDYIARMDADDICKADRLKRQLDYLKNNPEVDLLGSAITNIDDTDQHIGTSSFHNDMALIKKVIPYCSVSCHPTWMFKKEMFHAIGGYRTLQGAEDYDFLYRMIDSDYRIGNLPDSLLFYRIHGGSITSGMNLKRYKIRNYILEMHHERLTKGTDSYNIGELKTRLQHANDSTRIASLITKLRKAEAASSLSRLYYLSALFVCSADIRSRILDHLKLKLVVISHGMFSRKDNADA